MKTQNRARAGVHHEERSVTELQAESGPIALMH